LNPRTNHFCSACGHQLVDAYHPSEGLRVYATADPAAPLVEIVDPDSDITVVDTDEELPADFAKVTLEDGRVGYVRLREVADVAGGAEGEQRARPGGCSSSTAVLAVIVLMMLSAALVLVTALRSSDDTAGFIAVLTCVTVVPAMLFVVGFYLYVRKREDELADEAEERAYRESATRAGDQPASPADD
jgi:NADH:ubiquinone oxidoreductase subunit K